MNNTIYTKFKSIHKSSHLSILPHQLATLDFLLTSVLLKKNNVLVYHKTGSGKTMIGTCFSVLATKYDYKIVIILPNQSLMEIWKDHQIQALTLLPMDNYSLSNIIFETKTSFMKKIVTDDKVLVTNKIKRYDNYIIIVDEAHNIFDNDIGNTLQKMLEYITLKFVFLSGSPVTNTPDKIINIVELLDGKLDNEAILEKGKYVYDKQIFKDKLPLIEKKISEKISYFIQDPINIPKGRIDGYMLYQYPVIPCKMNSVQENVYTKVLKKEKNMMFSRQVQNVSFTALGDIDYTETSFKTNGREKVLLPNLTVVDGLFKGSELYDLNISSKVKKLVEMIKEHPCKRLIYFSNSTIGSLFLKSVLPVHGLTEYGSRPVDNFLCLNCKFKKTCPECYPVRYIIITSKELSTNNININNVLKIFNDRLNKDGRFLCMIFGSEVIEEGYTMKELKEIIFLTVPDSQATLSQVSGRGIRSWSHEDPNNSTVVIKILIATTSNDNIETYFDTKNNVSVSLDKTTIDTSLNNNKYIRFKKLLDSDPNKLSFDFRKILYLNLKHHGTKIVHKMLKKAGKRYESKSCKELIVTLLYEFLRQYFYEYNVYSYKSNTLFEDFFKVLDPIRISEIRNWIRECSITVYNKSFGYCNIIDYENEFIIYPIRLKYNRVLYKINISDDSADKTLDYDKKVGKVIIIYKKTNDVYNIKLDTGILSNITTLSKTKLIDIGTKYLGMDLKKNLTTKEIIDDIIKRCKYLNNTTNILYYQEV